MFYLSGLSYTYDYYWFLTWSLLGGVSISSLLACQDLTLCDVLGNQFAHLSHRLFSTVVGLGVLAFCFVHSMYFITPIIIIIFNFTKIYKFHFFGFRDALDTAKKIKKNLRLKGLSNL